MLMNEKLLFGLGRPFSPFYSAAMRLRERLYLAGIMRRNPLSVPVVSVGNIVLGGTGKTPTVKYIVELLVANGYSPAIISRGYKGRANSLVNIVSDGKSLQLSPLQAGDEPYMLASSLPHIPVLTGKKRIFPARFAISEFGADVLVLDDAFQHLRVRRDLDIVLFDGTFLAGNSRVFPGGVLREPVASLHRCHCFLVTGVNDTNSPRVSRFCELLEKKFPGKPVYRSQTMASATADSEARYFAFSGIANPERFIKTAESLKLNIIQARFREDHAHYTANILDDICRDAVKCGATHLLTTEKDFVKISGNKSSIPISVIKINAIPDIEFNDFVLSFLQNLKRKY